MGGICDWRHKDGDTGREEAVALRSTIVNTVVQMHAAYVSMHARVGTRASTHVYIYMHMHASGTLAIFQ